MYYLGKHKKDVFKHSIVKVAWVQILCCSARFIFIHCSRSADAFDLDCGNFSTFCQLIFFLLPKKSFIVCLWRIEVSLYLQHSLKSTGPGLPRGKKKPRKSLIGEIRELKLRMDQKQKH